MSRFFIDRPVFAWVLAIITMLVGVLSIKTMPVEQYPELAAPEVTISGYYPGAAAEIVQNSVTQVIEQQLTGIDNLRYFGSISESSGTFSITITFEPGTDPDTAQVQVQNKVQSAMSQLPQMVQAQGVTVEKAASGFLFVTSFYSENENITKTDLADIINSQIVEPISRVQGVGSVQAFGEPYAMRIWLDPQKLFSYNLSTSEVLSAVSEQNIDVSAGQLGAMPALEGQQINATVLAQSRLKSVDEFKRIIIRVNADGSQVRLEDVAGIELGETRYGTIVEHNGNPSAAFAVSLATGANALDTEKRVKERLAELGQFLPEGVHYTFPYDTTPFVRLSINSIFHTIIEAVILVFLVMFLFLQNFRATIIPTMAVPVVLLGSFAILNFFGFTINTLTMFAMVLAIGLLVDDAIVVVENVERVMTDEKLPVKEATKKSMDQISGALVGISLILIAVFAPMAFVSGSAGAIYRQFAITIIASMVFSVLVAMILTPTMCVALLKPPKESHGYATKGFFGWFNRMFNGVRDFTGKSSGFLARNWKRSVMVYALILVGFGFIFTRIPSGFLPDEDQGVMMFMATTPAGSTAERTSDAVKNLQNYLKNEQGHNVDQYITVVGFSFAGSGQNAAVGFGSLKHWDERKGKENSVMAVAGDINRAMSRVKDAMIFAFFPPAITSLGHSSGFDFHLVDYVGAGHEPLMQARNQLLAEARQNPKLARVRPNGMDDVPMFKIDIDMEKARALGLSISDINSTLQTAWGSSYVNDFMDRGRVKKVYVQGVAESRMQPGDLEDWYVKNDSGKMVSFSSFSKGHWTYGSPRLERFNGYASMNIQGSNAPGVSTGDAMAEIEKIADNLTGGIGYEWTGISYEERLAGSQAPLLYAIAVLFVFLSLAALYESWSIPFAVLFVIPLGIVGSIAGTYIMGLDNDIYFQVALLTTVGLCARNAILIVEFAKELYLEGHSLMSAALMAFKLRYRPIVMTSMAFILGVMPLAVSTGAGAASQNAIGVGVMGGMLASTFVAIFFVPLFFVVVERFSGSEKKQRSADKLANTGSKLIEQQ